MVKKDVALDPVTGDLYKFSRPVAGDEYLRQRLEIKLNTFFGEWYLDTDVGLPFFDWLETKPVPLEEIRTFITVEIESTPKVFRTENVEINFDDNNAIVFTCTVITDDERTLELQADTFEEPEYPDESIPFLWLFHVTLSPSIAVPF